MSTVSASLMGAIAIAVALCVPSATTPTTAPDPDIAWAEAVGPETLARVTAGVEAYLADPDLAVPSCWEDEAVVIIIDHVTPANPIPKVEPYVVADRVGELGCVPVDDLPVTGYRP